VCLDGGSRGKQGSSESDAAASGLKNSEHLSRPEHHTNIGRRGRAAAQARITPGKSKQILQEEDRAYSGKEANGGQISRDGRERKARVKPGGEAGGEERKQEPFCCQ
jgi:hypothetical protein